MNIANLTRYTIDYVPDSCDGDYVQHNVSKDGEYIKFEEAVEASSNSLQQLKAEILALRKDGVVADDMYWIGWNMALERTAGMLKQSAV